MRKFTKRNNPLIRADQRWSGASKILRLLSRGAPIYTGADAVNHLCAQHNL